MNYLVDSKKKISKEFIKWGDKYHYRFMFFNIIILFFFLLRSAGYFQPYFPISVNFIVILGLFLGIIILDIREKAIFFVTLSFWIFAGILSVIKIDVWAERTGIYAFEALLFGLILLITRSIGVETTFQDKYKKRSRPHQFS